MARVGIDGLSLFCMLRAEAEAEIRKGDRPANAARLEVKPGAQKIDMLLVPGKKSEAADPTRIDVKGWVRTLKQSNEFRVDDYNVTAAAVLKGKANGRTEWLTAVEGTVGTITVKFAPAWEPNTRPRSPDSNVRKSNSGTGFGAEIDAPYVPVTKMIGDFNDVISITYTR